MPKKKDNNSVEIALVVGIILELSAIGFIIFAVMKVAYGF